MVTIISKLVIVSKAKEKKLEIFMFDYFDPNSFWYQLNIRYGPLFKNV